VFSVRNIERRHKAHAQRGAAIDAVEQAAAGIAVADGWGRLTFVNPAFLRMWKFSDDKSVLEKHIAEFWHSQDAAKNLMQQPRQSASWSGELVARSSDGRQFKVLATASPFKNKKDDITKVIFTFSRM
jgi:PAS domain S-box-containing protein